MNIIIIIIFILLSILNLNIQAGNYKKYEFPPLENTNEIDYSNGNASNRVRNKSSYFQQPRYIYPKLEADYKNKDSSSNYNYPVEEQQQESNKQFKLPATKTGKNNEYNSRMKYQNLEQYRHNKNNDNNNSNQYNYYPNNSYSQSYPYNRYYQSPYSMRTNNPMDGFSNFYNSSPYDMSNPFSNNGYFGNSGWNPLLNGSSMRPNFNNRLMGTNPMQNYPNIRTPGYFSR